MRDHIAAQPSTFAQMIAAPDFTKYFTVGETALKNVPRGYEPGHLQAGFLKYQRWHLEYPIADAMLSHVDFASEAAEIFKKMQPFHTVLIKTLEGFVFPHDKKRTYQNVLTIIKPAR